MPAIIEVDQQREMVRNITTLDLYLDFAHKQFWGAEWLALVRQDMSGRPKEELTPDLFRFYGLVGIVAAQYGFESLKGQINRHTHYGWNRPLTHPAHQLGVLVYTAGLNTQAYPIKEELIQNDPSLDPGIWGVSLGAHDGKPTADVSDPLLIRAVTMERMGGRHPILLPDRPLNQHLSSIKLSESEAHPLSGNQADTLTWGQFKTNILPRLQRATEGLLDPIPLFNRALLN